MTTDQKNIVQVSKDSDFNGDVYHSLFANMLEGLAYCRMIYENGEPQDFEYIQVNKAFSQLTGLTDVVGKKITQIIPNIKHTNPELIEIYGRVSKTGNPEKFTSASDAFGGCLSVSVYSPQKDYFIAMFENITERKRSEDLLRETELRYRTLFEGAPFGIVVLDPESEGFIDFNLQACKQLGYEREEFAGLHMNDIDSLEKPNDTASRMKKIIENGRDDFETKHRTKNGEIKDIFVTAQATKIANRLVCYSIWRDITEEKKAELESQISYDEAKKVLALMTGREVKMSEMKSETEQLRREISALKAGT
ncbi:hypothetical protein A3B57_00470 [Microgenomates group bacterium RIFCSPLOWO2_01_FULL_47_10]|nr:MAG: hypothetical protein A3B57_00470 [Microgenomates group bacterium RIFCSPLOWO2_01_FULL_47_10]